MLKVLYLPLGEQPGTSDAFRNAGVELDVFNFWGMWENTRNVSKIYDEFLARVKKIQPNLIHMQLQFTGIFNEEVLREAKKIAPHAIITNWTGDVRATAQPEFVKLSHAVDYSLISSIGQLDMYKAAGCKNVRYWQIGYDPKVNYPLNKESFKYDVVFLANNYGTTFPDGKIREEAARVIRSHFSERAGVFGSGHVPPVPALDPSRANETYNDSMCTLSISHFNNISHYFSDRLLGCLASGRPTISWYFPGIESYFVEGKEILVVRNTQDIVNAINYCKANPEAAKQIGINGAQKALKEHTFTSRIIELLTMTNLIGLV
jgi:glycosyltransferase involved in cell wall biosynthesis